MRRTIAPLALAAVLALSSVAAQDTPAPAPTPVHATTEGVPMAESIAMTVRGTASIGGELTFNFIPAGGETSAIRLTVAAGTPARDVVTEVAKALTAAMSPDFIVERPDPEKLKVSVVKKGASFRLSLAGLTARGLTVQLH